MTAKKTSSESDKIKGSVKEAIGKIIGDGKVAAEGREQQETPKSDTTPKPKSKH